MAVNTANKPDAFSSPYWTPELLAELETASTNGQVGSRMVGESKRARVWLIEMKPGDRLAFHTHVLDYFWVATSAGKTRSRYGDGRVAETNYDVGTTMHFEFKHGESMTHDLENIGDTVLCFTTVEYLESDNSPLF